MEVILDSEIIPSCCCFEYLLSLKYDNSINIISRKYEKHLRRNPVFVTCTVVVNIFLLVGAVIKIWSVVIEAEDDYNDVRSQVEICFTGIGKKDTGCDKYNVVIASKGIVLLFLNNFYWFQLNRTLGPIATTLMRVIHDVLKVAFAYLLFLVAFGTGIHLVLNNAVYGYEKCDDDDVRIK